MSTTVLVQMMDLTMERRPRFEYENITSSVSIIIYIDTATYPCLS
jgi:hypothetical protein